jgi:hypothetical protein
MAPDPLQEAFDPSTDPERLRQLAGNQDWAIRQVAWRNPSLPEDAWRTAPAEWLPRGLGEPDDAALCARLGRARG